MTVAHGLRVVRTGWLVSMKELTHSSFFVLVSILQPVIFATIAFFMVEAGGRSGTLLYTALGAGLMGIWSATLFGSGGLIQWERYQGTLELLVAAPAGLVFVLLGSTLATSSIGIYAIGATLLWGSIFFGVPLDVAHPLLFVIAIPVTILGLGLLGLVLATTFVLYRHANALSNLLEYPVWLVTGLLVPVSLLPGWVAPIGWFLAPTWGIKAIRTAALGGDPLPAIGATLALSALYLGLGAIAIKQFERLSRERATLALT
ncbi:MAG TPA: ABC transporter permease [Actinomycetota bacterium]|nr:ABC transporter permease [Actinomycetota bacterium]